MEKNHDYKKIAILILVTATVIGVVWIIHHQIKAEKETKRMKDDIKSLLQYQIEQSQKPNKLNQALTNLIAYFQNKDSDIHEELKEALALLDKGKEAEAARVITVVIENVLKKKAKAELNDWYLAFSKPEKITLANLIDKFKSVGFFNEEEAQLAGMVRVFRNNKSHKPNIEGNTSYNEKMLHVHVGILLLNKCVAS